MMLRGTIATELLIKKAFTDPVSDYLLHDDDRISSMGSIARGTATLGGIGAGGFGAHGINKVIEKVKGGKIGNLAKILSILGGAAGLGAASHFYADSKLKYTPTEQIYNKLNKLYDLNLQSNADAAPSIAIANVNTGTPAPAQTPDTSSQQSSSMSEIFNKLKNKISNALD